MTQLDTTTLPDLSAIAGLRARLKQWVRTTPVFDKTDFEPVPGTAVNFKLELLQASGTFKARGAFSNLLALDDDQRAAGVTCVSAGNHAVAVAYAAMRLGIPAKVVMIKTASPARVALCRQYGAEVVLAETARRHSIPCTASKARKGASSCTPSMATARCWAPPR